MSRSKYPDTGHVLNTNWSDIGCGAFRRACYYADNALQWGRLRVCAAGETPMQNCAKWCGALSVLLCVLLRVPAAAAPKVSQVVPPPALRVIGETTNVRDVLVFLGIHSWKVRVVVPPHGVSVGIVQFVRNPHGDFIESRGLGGGNYVFSNPTKFVDVTVMYQETSTEDRIQISTPIVSSPPASIPKSLLQGYVQFGDLSGGTGLKVGSEYILMAKYFNRNTTTPNKKDMSAYVALQIYFYK